MVSRDIRQRSFLPRLQTRNLKVIWEEPHRHPSRQRITTPQGYNWLQCDVPHLPPKTAPSLRRSSLPVPSNTPIPWPTPLTTPNGIHIQSAFLPQYTLQPDRLTDQQMGYAMGLYQDPLTLCIVQELRAIYLLDMTKCLTGIFGKDIPWDIQNKTS